MVRCCAGTEQRRESERQRREEARLLKAALSVARDHHAASVVTRCGWRPWRCLVQQTQRVTKQAAAHRCAVSHVACSSDAGARHSAFSASTCLATLCALSGAMLMGTQEENIVLGPENMCSSC